MYKLKTRVMDATREGLSGREIGLGVLSVLTGVVCAEPCTAALLHVMGAVSAARIASSTLLVAGVAVLSLGWALWRLYRTHRACANKNCLSASAFTYSALFIVAAFAVDVTL